jgi:hypothetical protein
MNKSTNAIVQNFITFTGIQIKTAIESFNIPLDDWLKIESGEELPNVELIAKMLDYTMAFRHDVKSFLSPNVKNSSAPEITDINDFVAIEVEQLDAITNLLQGHRSAEIRQIGNLISAPSSRLSSLIESK